MDNCTLVIDQGGHSTRALAFDSEFRIRASSQAHLQPGNTAAKDFHIEHSPEQLKASLFDCLRKIRQELDKQSLRIQQAALITQRSSLLACQKNTLEPLSPVISWQDTRNNQWLQSKLEKTLDRNRLKQKTGLYLNAHYGASKMRWLLDHAPQVKQAYQDKNLLFMPLAAYCSHLLTQDMNATVDTDSASRTYLKELDQQDWSVELLQLFDIDRSCLPALKPVISNHGLITTEQLDMPLQLVGGDQSFLSFAYGTEAQTDSLFINAGTGAFVQCVLPNRKEVPPPLLCSQLGHHQITTIAEGTVNAAASALDWLWQKNKKNLEPADIELALKDSKNIPIFFNRITALGSPYWLPAGESHFSTDAELPQQAVAVIENIVFLLCCNIDLLIKARPDLRRIYISGGISNYDGFCQKLASCSKLDVVRHGDHEASARGAAMFLTGQKTYNPVSEPAIYKPDGDTALEARYRHYTHWLESLN